MRKRMARRGSNVKSRKFHAGRLVGGRHVRVAALIATGALLLAAPAAANAASPVLEVVTPHGLPVSFTTEGGLVNAEMAGFETLVRCAASGGEGEITGPRSAVASFTLTGCTAENGSRSAVGCKSEDANPEEIKTGPIAAELVYIDQAKREVGILLNPGEGPYIIFECGGEKAEGRGSFLASVAPIDEPATSFTTALRSSLGTQMPDEYENEKGEKRAAIPEGKRGSHELETTGVETTITVHPSEPIEIKAVTAAEVEARQLEEKQREEAAMAAAAAKKHQEEEAAAAKKRQEEEAAAAKKRQEEEAAATKKREEEAKAAKHKSKSPPRAQLLAKALRVCEKQPKRQRTRCMAAAHKKYGSNAKKKRGKH